jgi:hypothetical protein
MSGLPVGVQDTGEPDEQRFVPTIISYPIFRIPYFVSRIPYFVFRIPYFASRRDEPRSSGSPGYINFHADPLRCKTIDRPPLCHLLVAKAIVETARSALPKFDHSWDDPETTPMIGTGNVAVGMLVFEFFQPSFQNGAIGDHFALIGGPSSEPTSGGTAVVVFVRFGRGNFLNSALDPHLPFLFGPEEDQRGVGIGQQFLPFMTVVIREENKPPIVHGFQQNNPRRWDAVRGGSGDRHGIGFWKLGGYSGIEPGLELDDGIGINICFD